MGTLADDLLLLRATSLQRVLVSQDEDMLREGGKLQRDGTPFSGIVYAHQNRVTIGQLVQDLELIAAATLPEEVNNQIWHLPF